MVWLILLLVVILLLLFYFRDNVRLVYLAINLPGPRHFDPLGNFFLLSSIANGIELWIMRYGMCRLVKFWVTLIPMVVLLDPKDIKMVINNEKIAEKSATFRNILKCVIGEGLITNNGHQWKKNRKVIQTIFNMNVLKSFTHTFLENAENIVNLLKDNTDLDIVSYINQYALQNAWHTILGISLSSDEAELKEKRDILSGHHKFTYWTVVKGLYNQITLDKNAKVSKTHLQYFIKQLIEDNNNNQIKQNKFKSFLEWLSEISVEDDNFTEEDVVNEASTLIHASYDTVRAAIAYSLYFLAKHQDVQEKIVQELQEIYSNTSNEITTNELNEMRYLEQCINESMRIYPSAPYFSRQVTQEIVIDNRVLPVGTNIVISPLLLHRLPHLFPEPLKFDPERFSKENLSKMDPYSFLPFSRGPRNCIGYKYAILEMKTFIASLLRKYRISLTPGHEHLKFAYNITLVARGGIWLHFNERNPNS